MKWWNAQRFICTKKCGTFQTYSSSKNVTVGYIKMMLTVSNYMSVELSSHAPDDTSRMLLGGRQIYTAVVTREQMGVVSISFRNSFMICSSETKL